MSSWWRKYAESLGNPETGNGSWARRAAELLGSTAGVGPWEKRVATANAWERRRGFREWIASGESSGTPAFVPTLQLVASRGEMSDEFSPNGLHQTHRTRHYIGTADVSTLALIDANWSVMAGVETPGPVEFTLRRAVEYNGVTVPMTWAGAQVIVVQPGETVTTDEIPASAFGVEAFPAGAQFWVRGERTRVGSQKLSVHNSGSSYSGGLIAGENTMTRSVADASQVYNSGNLTTTGGWTNTFGATMWFPIAIIGKPTAPMMSLLIVGASKETGQADFSGDGSTGGGYVRRAMFPSHIAYSMIQSSGESAKRFVADSARRRTLLQYATHIISGHGGNDYSLGSMISVAVNDVNSEISLLSATGLKPRMILEMPKTNSTDSWATVENQTPKANYETGGTWRDAFNTHLTSLAGTTLAAVIDLNPAVAAAASPDRWAATMAQDGVHPSKEGHAALVEPVKAVLESLRSAHEA